MKKRNVLISIKGLQSQFDDNNDIELVTEGLFYKDDSKYYATYEETEMTGMTGTTTTLEIEPKKVTLIRNGMVNNQMLFIKDKKTTSYYDTGFGNLVVGILTDKVDVDVDDNGGHINIAYNIDINEEYLGSNTFDISIKNA